MAKTRSRAACLERLLHLFPNRRETVTYIIAQTVQFQNGCGTHLPDSRALDFTHGDVYVDKLLGCRRSYRVASPSVLRSPLSLFRSRRRQ